MEPLHVMMMLTTDKRSRTSCVGQFPRYCRLGLWLPLPPCTLETVVGHTYCESHMHVMPR